MLQPEGSGGAKKICDIVRDMFECDNMATVAELLKRVANCPEIEVVRFKDRVTNHSNGWRDAMINYKVKGTDHDHICEVQIVHEKMLKARVHFGGHGEYGRDRNAREILEYLGEPEKGTCNRTLLAPLQPRVAPAVHQSVRHGLNGSGRARVPWALAKAASVIHRLGRNSKVGSVAPMNGETSDLPPPPTIHRPAPERAAPTAQLAQPARAPAAQHAAPGALQPAGAPSTGHIHLKKVAKVNNAVRPLPPLARPGVPRPLPPTL